MLTLATFDKMVQKYGPYAYHGANCRNSTPESAIIKSILTHGIMPNHRVQDPGPCPTAPWGTENWEDCDWDNRDHEVFGVMGYDDWWLSPRPDHVFMTFDFHEAYGDPLFIVDLTKLDISLINPDDDYFRDWDLSFEKFPHRKDDPRLAACGELSQNGWRPSKRLAANELTLGQQVEKIGWGEHESETIAGGLY